MLRRESDFLSFVCSPADEGIPGLPVNVGEHKRAEIFTLRVDVSAVDAVCAR